MEMENNILFYRNMYGWTREELAKRLNVGQSTVQRWEENKVCPRISDGHDIARVFDLTLDDIFYEKGKTPLKRIPNSLQKG